MVTSENNRIIPNNEQPFEWLTRTIVENKNITYPIYCMIIDLIANYFKVKGRLWLNEQQQIFDKQSMLKDLDGLKKFVEGF